MIHLVFMLEEPSAKCLLDELLPSLLPEGVSFQCIPHEGKQDLEKSIPIKLRCWNIPNNYFVILRDKDQGDKEQIITHLKELCDIANRPDTLVRVAVHELESWFLGDLAAVAMAYKQEDLKRRQNSAKYRDPDSLANAQEELKKLVKGYQKMSGARKIAPYINTTLNYNKSASFNEFLSGVTDFIESIRAQAA